MEAVALELAQDLLKQVETTAANRLLVGLGGIPGSGKTSLALMIARYLNELSPGVCAVVSLDGWHYSRAHLQALPNPQEAFDRRGAEWTFDAEGYAQFLAQLRSSSAMPVDHAVFAPAFDHALKDPTNDAVEVLSSHRIVIIEGLYVLLGTGRWRPAVNLLDERWFLDVSFAQARTRILNRHVQTGVSQDLEEAAWRADNNDLPSEP